MNALHIKPSFYIIKAIYASSDQLLFFFDDYWYIIDVQRISDDLAYLYGTFHTDPCLMIGQLRMVTSGHKLSKIMTFT